MHSAEAARPIGEGLFTWPCDNPVLFAWRAGSPRMTRPNWRSVWLWRWCSTPIGAMNTASNGSTLPSAPSLTAAAGSADMDVAIVGIGIHPFGRTAERGAFNADPQSLASAPGTAKLA